MIEHYNRDYCVSSYHSQTGISSLSISTDGQVLAIGVYIDQFLNWDDEMTCWDREDIKGISQLRVMRFVGLGKDWKQQGDSISRDGDDEQVGGPSVSLLAHGDFVLVAWPLVTPFDEMMDKSIAVYYCLHIQISRDCYQVGDYITGVKTVYGFGVSYSQNGNIIAVREDNHYKKPHKIKMFRRGNRSGNGFSWEKFGNTIDIYQENLWLGISSLSLSFDGLTIAVGIRNRGQIGGYAKVFRYDENVWNQVGGKIGEASHDESNCYSVSLSSDGLILAMGNAYSSKIDVPNPEPLPSPTTARVQVFKYDDGEWGQVGDSIDGLIPKGIVSAGYSVALTSDGSQVVLGGPSGSDEGGRVRVMKYYEI